MMLEELKNDGVVEFKPNYDNTTEEPKVLPSRFPYLLCGNNSGIAVGMSSDLVSHNFSEVAAAIEYYIGHRDCSVADLLHYIQGPDFPTGGQILNGDDLLNIYSTGRGAVKVQAHYDVVKKGQKTLLIFHDLPYGVDIDNGVKAPLKKLVLDDGYDVFEDINVAKVGTHNFDITITLGKGADVQKCLDILFSKTRLCESVKINQTLIVDGEPRLLSLKQMIEYWVNYRSNIIKRVAANDYTKTNHKLTVVLGLQKCMSDIDTLVSLIRNSNSRADAKVKIMQHFALNDEQADAVLDMKLSKLSRLDLQELNDNEAEYRKTLARLREIIDNESVRDQLIVDDLKDIKKVLGADERLTEICYNSNSTAIDQPKVKNEWLVYPTGIEAAKSGVQGTIVENNLVDVIMAYNPQTIWGYNKDGEIFPANARSGEVRGAFMLGKEKVVSVTKNGYVKVSLASDFKWKRTDRAIKLKDGDELMFIGLANDSDFLMLFDGERVLKLAISDFTVAGKLTIGVRSGYDTISAALVVSSGDKVFMMTSDNKGKFTPVNDFTTDSRGNKGQLVAEKTVTMHLFAQGRENLYVFSKTGKPQIVTASKFALKGKTAAGALVSSRVITKVI